MRIAIGGLHIESSEFSAYRSSFEDFRVLEGEGIVERYGIYAPEVGDAIEIVPLIHARALPGGPVTREFFDAWGAQFFGLLDEALSEGGVDGVLLYVHGAASVIGMDDPEGWIVARVREMVGPEVPIACAMDLHGNVSDQLFDAADYLTCYRTAPHVDEAETEMRAFRALVRLVEERPHLHRAKVDIPILLPGEKTSTQVEPGASLYGMLERVIAEHGVWDASIWMGYPWADQPRCHGAIVTEGTRAKEVEAAAREIAEAYWGARHEFAFVGPTEHEEPAIAAALASSAHPFFLSDMGDNPGAGGFDDTTGFLRKLHEAYRAAGSEKHVAFASVYVPKPAVRAAGGEGDDGGTGAGTGAVMEMPFEALPMLLGRELTFVLPHGFELTATVVRTFVDAMGGEGVVLADGNFKVLITQARTQFSTARQFENAGIELGEEDIVVVKMGYLEPELSAAAADWIMVLTPGAVDQDLVRLPYEHLTHPSPPSTDSTSRSPRRSAWCEAMGGCVVRGRAHRKSTCGEAFIEEGI